MAKTLKQTEEYDVSIEIDSNEKYITISGGSFNSPIIPIKRSKVMEFIELLKAELEVVNG